MNKHLDPSTDKVVWEPIHFGPSLRKAVEELLAGAKARRVILVSHKRSIGILDQCDDEAREIIKGELEWYRVEGTYTVTRRQEAPPAA